MIVFRLLRLGIHLLIGLLTCALVFPLVDAAGRQRRIQRWSRQLLGICRIKVMQDNPQALPAARALTIANHISWLDIFVINALQPYRFVAKSDIRGWPLIGWLCEKSGTIFISRGNRRDVRRIFEGLVKSIHDGEHVAFFPEGTTGVQGELLPFHANLFEAAIDADVPVQPFALRYLDGDGNYASSVEFVGEMSFAQSIIAILKGGAVTAHLTLLPAIDASGSHRRDLAQRSHDAIARGLRLAPAAEHGQATSPAFDTAGTSPAAVSDLPGTLQ